MIGCTVLGRRHPRVGFHIIAGNDCVGIFDEVVEGGLVTDDAAVLHGVGKGIAGERAGLPPDDACETWSEAVVAFLDRMTGAAGIVEEKLAGVILRNASAGRSAKDERGERNPQALGQPGRCNSVQWGYCGFACKAVNGGTHGFSRLKSAYGLGDDELPA